VPGICRWPRFVSGRLVLFRRRWVFVPGEAPAEPRVNPRADPLAAAAGFFHATARWRF
jgi:hypothetical protein